jgi:LytS/YehU family sensor histidine kinase
VTFTNLDPGRYVFRVKASNTDGVWSDAPASLEVVVTPPFWRTWWFRTLAAGSLLLALAGIHRLRVRHLERRERLLSARVERLAAERAQTLVADAQLKALRAQLNPHFLYNALHSVSALVRLDAAGAEEALDRLGELLRYALAEEASADVPLAEEWNFVRHYLALESLRFGPRLRLETCLDPEALDGMVPSFLLQPLVENAVRHGVAPRPEGGTVRVEARVEQRHLVLRVADDGPGTTLIEAEQASGLGLRALRRRLKARYAGAAAVEIATARGAGFEVVVRLPVAFDSGRAA